tara:strand:+ start:2942 stop:3286 length:345 start_codon:yes stop_codon:yes gene_type:complete
MKALVAVSQHWLNSEKIRDVLVELPISSTVMISDRVGGDTLASKIAEEELALRVEKIDVTSENFRKLLTKIIAEDDLDACYFFTLGTHEVEYALSRISRASRIPTETVTESFGV